MIEGVARSPHPPLRHRRDRQRELALKEPRLAFPLSPRLRNPDQLRRGERYRSCHRRSLTTFLALGTTDLVAFIVFFLQMPETAETGNGIAAVLSLLLARRDQSRRCKTLVANGGIVDIRRR